MNALVSFVMRGPLQSILVIVVCAAISLILPPVSIFTAAIIALITLRNGVKPGLTILLGASLILGFFAFVAMPNGLAFAFLISLVVTVIPVWFLAIVLRTTISLAKTLSAAVLLGCVMVLFVHMAFPDPAQWWESVLTAALQPAFDAGQLTAEGLNLEESVKALSAWMTGLVAAAMVSSFIASLLLGRWMQSLLYNPGGFKEEFFGVRLGRELSIVTVAALLVAGLLGGGGGAGVFAQDLLWVFGAVYVIPGLSIIHQWIGTLAKPVVWLVVTYVLLLFVPQVMAIIAIMGLVDTWVNIRARLPQQES